MHRKNAFSSDKAVSHEAVMSPSEWGAHIRVLPGAKNNFKSTNKKRAHSTFYFWHILKSEIAEDHLCHVQDRRLDSWLCLPFYRCRAIYTHTAKVGSLSRHLDNMVIRVWYVCVLFCGGLSCFSIDALECCNCAKKKHGQWAMRVTNWCSGHRDPTVPNWLAHLIWGWVT